MYKIVSGDVFPYWHMAGNHKARDPISSDELGKSIARTLGSVWLIGREFVSFKRHDLCSTRTINRSMSRPSQFKRP